MRQQLVKNLVFILLVNILVKTIWIFFIDRNVQLQVGYASYGAFQALFNLGLIFQILLDFGLSQCNSKEIATDPKRIRVLFSSMFWTKLILILVYTMIVLSVAYLLGYSGIQIKLLLAVLAIHSLNAMATFLRSNIAAMHYFRTDGVLAVVDRLLMIIVCGALLILPQFTQQFKIEWFVASQIASYFLAAVIAFFVLLKLSPVAIHFSFRPKMIKKILKHSAPYALLVFLMSIYMRSDVVMIERLCGTAGKLEAGIYISAFRLLDVANIFGLMFAGMLLPIFAKMIAQKESLNEIIKTSVNIMLPISFAVAVFALFFGTEIMQLLYHKESNAQDGKILGVLLSSFPAFCLMYIYSTLLTANGSMRMLNKISLFIVCVNLILHYLLISSYQSMGAACGVLATEWLVALLVIVAAHKIFALPHNYKWLFSHIGFIIALLIFATILHFSHLDWFFQFAILFICTLVLLFTFRFWSVATFKELISRKDVNS